MKGQTSIKMNFSMFSFVATAVGILVVFGDGVQAAVVTVHSSSVESIDSLEYQTSKCSQCGMTVFGSVATKVCGNAGCCLTPWDQGSFKEGGLDIMGGHKIGECDNFPFSDNDDPDSIGKYTADQQ